MFLLLWRRREAPPEKFIAFMFPFAASLSILKSNLVVWDPDNYRASHNYNYAYQCDGFFL